MLNRLPEGGCLLIFNTTKPDSWRVVVSVYRGAGYFAQHCGGDVYIASTKGLFE